MENPVGLDGMDFMEYVGTDATLFEKLFVRLGFRHVATHKTKNILLYRQGDIQFFINKEHAGFAASFTKAHGPCISATGFRVHNAEEAFKIAVSRGAKPYTNEAEKTFPIPAIYGIGDSLVYFVDKKVSDLIYKENFNYDLASENIVGSGFTVVDHMTNNVPMGEMQKWCDFYEKVFNFKERRFFDIRGTKTGLISKVMGGPCGKIIIPIN
ncbi:MAG: VOC family protein, partial [Bdellovibrionaceae bacterium]|nr:VOC family protein [Pseudobdellovibrionaceae bacterium]